MSNPFTTKLTLGKYPNNVIFAQVLFNKAVTGQYPAKYPVEPIRQAITDYEGPENRNTRINLDDAQFFCEFYNDTSYWIGVTDITDTHKPNPFSTYSSYSVDRYDRIMEDGSRCIVIPRCTFDTPENTIRSVHCLIDVARYVNDGQVFFGDMVYYIYIAANYMYRALGINILSDENFAAVFENDMKNSYNGKGLYKDYKEFIDTDAKYVGVISNDDMNFSKLLGTKTRYDRFLKERDANEKRILETANTGMSQYDIRFIQTLNDYVNSDEIDAVSIMNLVNFYKRIIVEDAEIKKDDAISAIKDTYVAIPYLVQDTFDEKDDNVASDIVDVISYGLNKIWLTVKHIVDDDKDYWPNDFPNIYYLLIYLSSNLPGAEYGYMYRVFKENALYINDEISEKKDVLRAVFDFADLNYNNPLYKTTSYYVWINSMHDGVIQFITTIMNNLSTNSDSNKAIESSEDDGDTKE